MEWGENTGYLSSNCLSVHPRAFCLTHTHYLPLLWLPCSPCSLVRASKQNRDGLTIWDALKLTLSWPWESPPTSTQPMTEGASGKWKHGLESWNQLPGVNGSRKAASCLFAVDWGCEMGCSTGLEAWETCSLFCWDGKTGDKSHEYNQALLSGCDSKNTSWAWPGSFSLWLDLLTV